MLQFVMKNKRFYSKAKGNLGRILSSMDGKECKVWGQTTIPAEQTKGGKEFVQTVISFPSSFNPSLKFHVRPCDIVENVTCSQD